MASGEGVNIPFNVSPDLLQAIRQLAQANSCTLIMFFTAAYQVCMVCMYEWAEDCAAAARKPFSACLPLM